MEQGFITVFKNLESIYPSLYDLFNQNFLIKDNKKFARIAIGYSNNKPYEVNDNFKSIIIIEQNDIKKQDPPFLNRFEKYLFSFEILLNEELIKKSKTFEEMIKYLITKSDEKKTVINLEKQLICCGLEEIQGLIYQLNKKGKQNNELLDEVFKKISKLFSQDILAYAYKKNYHQKYPDVYQKIESYYIKSIHTNLFNFLKNMNNHKNIIYTFSDILETTLNFNENIINQKFGIISKNSIEEDIFLYNITSERQLEEKIEKFLKDNNKNVCFIKLFPFDCVHLNHVKFLIENFERNQNSINKVFIFFIHLKRYIFCFEDENKKIDDDFVNNQNLISLLSDFSQTFIDNLNGINISIFDLLKLNNKVLLEKKEIININQEIKDIIYDIFLTIEYKFKNVNENNFKNNYKEDISKKLIDNEIMCTKLNNLVIKLIEDDDDLIKQIFYEKNIFEKIDIDFISVLLKFIKLKYKEKLNKIIVNCEKDNVISNMYYYKIQIFKIIYYILYLTII